MSNARRDLRRGENLSELIREWRQLHVQFDRMGRQIQDAFKILGITGGSDEATDELWKQSAVVRAAASYVGQVRWLPGFDGQYDSDAADLAWATGTLVAPGVLLTAAHVFSPEESDNVRKPRRRDGVLSRPELAQLMQVRFGYEKRQDGTVVIGDSFPIVQLLVPGGLGPDDFATVRLGRSATGVDPGSLGQAECGSSMALTTDTPLFCIQHRCAGRPGDPCNTAGTPKLYAPGMAADCRDQKVFTHTCDTSNGASGAPIFDVNGCLIGVHVGGDGGDGAPNTAIRIDHILDVMKKK